MTHTPLSNQATARPRCPNRLPSVTNLRPAFIIISALCAVTLTSAHALDWAVNNTTDSGIGSLREAIASAVAAPGDDRIEFAAGLNGQTITLLTAELGITHTDGALHIDASSLNNGVTVSGGDTFRVFHITANSSVEMTGLTITNGHAPDGGVPIDYGENGGGILADTGSALTLTDCNITNNTSGNGADSGSSDGGSGGYGGGICSFGTLTLSNCTVANNTAGDGGDGGFFGNGGNGGNGGGIYLRGTLTMTDCSVSGNDAGIGGSSDFGEGDGGDGAGIRLDSPSTTGALVGCTVSGNDNARFGGGLAAYANMLTLTNCTVTDNTAMRGGGVDVLSSETRFVNCTITQNTATFPGGGLWISENVTPPVLENTIVTGNTGGFVPAPDDVSGDFTAEAVNIISVHPFGAVSGSGAVLTVAPDLAPLADNGGPTLTMLPLPGSPAIDAGSSTANTPLTDQRGFGRVVGDALDIGAVETGNGTGTSFVDTDSDDMDDTWEELHGLTVGIDDSGLDLDGDGITNAQEAGDHTDPSDPDSALRIIAFEFVELDGDSNLVCDLTWTSSPDLTYEVLCSPDMAPANWSRSTLGAIAGAADNPTTKARVTIPSDDCLFVRIQRKP